MMKAGGLLEWDTPGLKTVSQCLSQPRPAPGQALAGSLCFAMLSLLWGLECAVVSRRPTSMYVLEV